MTAWDFCVPVKVDKRVVQHLALERAYGLPDAQGHERRRVLAGGFDRLLAGQGLRLRFGLRHGLGAGLAGATSDCATAFRVASVMPSTTSTRSVAVPASNR